MRMMTMFCRRGPRPAAAAGFSLVEVTLALGVVGFGLVAVIGVLPVALTTSRTSIAQTRAASLAETVFAGLRAEKFRTATPGRGLEADGGTLPVLDLATRQTPTGTNDLTLYAVLTETAAPGEGDTRRLRFTDKADDVPKLVTAAKGGASTYRLEFAFKMDPEGVPTHVESGATVGAASRILLTVRPGTGGTADAFRFVTLIANRGS